MSSRATWLTVVLAIASMMAYSGSIAAQPSRPLVFTYAMANYPTVHDPAEGVSGPNYRVFINTHEALAGYKLGTTQLEPVLARRWEASPDLKTYTFFLRDGVKFHDGSPLTAQDVKSSLDRIIAAGKSPASYVATIERVEAVNPLTVRVRLKGPSATFIDAVTRAYIHKVPAGIKVSASENWFINNINGTGPYRVVEDVREERIVLERYTGYWRPWPAGAPTRVIQRRVPEIATARILLERGEVDGIDYNFDDSADAYKARGMKVFMAPGFRTFTMNMNTVGGYTADINFRKALAHAFPYDELRSVFHGLAQTPNGFLPPGYPGYDSSLPKYTQDLAKAKEFLALAGYPNGGVTIQMMHRSGEEQGRRMALIVQQTLRQLNINVEIIPATTPLYQKALDEANNKEAVEIIGHQLLSPLTADTSSYLRLVFGSVNAGKPFNWSLYTNPEFDRMLARAEVTPNRSARETLWKSAHAMLLRDQPIVFTGWIIPVANIFSPRITRYTYHPMEYSGVPYFLAIRMLGR